MTPDVQRWFDGTDWTEHTRPLPEAALARSRAAGAAGVAVGGAAGVAVGGAAGAADGGAAYVTAAGTTPSDSATGASWQPAGGGAWLPEGGAVPEPTPAPEATPSWGSPSAAAYGSGSGAYGTTSAAYGASAGGYGTGVGGSAGAYGAGVGASAGAYGAGVGASAGAYGAAGVGVASGAPGLGVAGLGGQGFGGSTFGGQGTGWGAGGSLGGWAVPSGSPAHWGWRVLASQLDGIFVCIPYLVAFGYAQTTATLGVDRAGFLVSEPTPEGQLAVVGGVLVMWVLLFVNRVVLQGRTGQSWGKRIVGLRTVHEDTEEPIGMWWAFVRDVAHVVNALPLYLGYLWPLWDARRQTFSDKVTHSVVLRDPR